MKNFGNLYPKALAQGIVPSEHTIYLVVELLTEPDTVFLSSTTTTSIKNFNDLGQEVIEFPIKIKDLPILTSVNIKLYDMNRVKHDGLIATTSLDLYDTKKRLRQGVVSLYLNNVSD